jgi:hypothetical protein
MPRKYRTMPEWRELITKCESSGQTQKDWCISNGVNLYTYRDRANRLRKADGLGMTTMFKKTEPSGKQNSSVAKHQTTDIHDVKWATVKPNQILPDSEEERRNRITSDGSHITVEMKSMRITADALYPIEKLAELFREASKCC